MNIMEDARAKLPPLAGALLTLPEHIQALVTLYGSVCYRLGKHTSSGAAQPTIKMHPVPEDMQKVLTDNVWDLYATDDQVSLMVSQGPSTALSNFQEGQWWVKELDDAAQKEGAPDDIKRAVAVVHALLRTVRNVAPTDSHEFQRAPELDEYFPGSRVYRGRASEAPQEAPTARTTELPEERVGYYQRVHCVYPGTTRAIEAEVAALHLQKILELERLCDATYVAQGADAYNHACSEMERWQAERVAAGKDPGTTGSLCDGLDWLYRELKRLEVRAEPLPAGYSISEILEVLERVKARHWTHWSGHDLSDFNLALHKLRHHSQREQS